MEETEHHRHSVAWFMLPMGFGRNREGRRCYFNVTNHAGKDGGETEESTLLIII